MVARRAEKLQELKSELNAVRPGSAKAESADLENFSDVERIAAMLRTEPIDILVNNAGRGSFGPLEELPLKGELAMIDLNVRATVTLAQAPIERLKKQKFGALFGIASIAAMQPLPYMATYSATKAFNFNHTVALWAELKRYGVYATAVCPGPTDTEFAGVARVPGHFSGSPRDPVSVVVKRSIQALELGLPFVVPGIRSWLMSAACRVCPKIISTLLTERSLRGILNAR